MTKKKRRRPQPRWWRWRRFGWPAGLLAFAAVIGVVVYLVAVSGGPSQQPGGAPPQSEYLVEPATDFSLTTTDGGRFTLADHLGQHNVLLFFNEGLG